MLSDTSLHVSGLDLQLVQTHLNGNQGFLLLLLELLQQFIAVSLTVSPISFRSPSVKVIGSSDDLLALDFFRDPTFSYSLLSLTWNGVVSRSAPPYRDYCSSSSICGEGDF